MEKKIGKIIQIVHGSTYLYALDDLGQIYFYYHDSDKPWNKIPTPDISNTREN